ncbi:MAG: pyridoxamine 5'-phosphate oxidase family protein [Parcubacteria group bacterium]
MEDYKARLIAELDKRRVVSVATVRPDGWPQATIVGYCNDGPLIYFMVAREGQKFKNLAENPRCSLCVGEDVTDPMQIGGASLGAVAEEVTDPAELAKVTRLMFGRYPEYESMMKDADMSGMAVLRATPFVASVLDYEKGFGHMTAVELAPRPVIAANAA